VGLDALGLRPPDVHVQRARDRHRDWTVAISLVLFGFNRLGHARRDVRDARLRGS
jgi:hypothetical protein